MTKTERLQWQIFVLLIVAVIASIYYFSGPPNENPTISDVRKVPARSDDASDENLPELSMLQQQLPEFDDVKRNVFKFRDGSDSEDHTPVAETEPMVLPDSESTTPTGPDVTYLGFYHGGSQSL